MQERYLFTDRPEAASGREDDSESAWEEFQRLIAAPAAAQQPRTAPAASADAAPRAAAASASQVGMVLALMERHHRVCLKPGAWYALHALLSQHAAPADAPPPPPADADSWLRTSAAAKAACFRDHLRWAERRPAALQRATEFLLGLPEHAWYCGELRAAGSV